MSKSRRQVNLVYQPDGLLIDNDGRQAEVSQSSSTQEIESSTAPVSSTPTSTANGTTQPSSNLPTQILATTSASSLPPTLSAQQAAQQSFLIAPTTLVNVPSESNSDVAMSSTSPSLSLLSTTQSTPSHALSSSSTRFSLSTPSSLLPQTQISSTSSALTSSAYVILPTNSSTSASSASATAQALSASGHRTSEFYIGVVFLSIVAAALCISLIAWTLRKCRRNPSCCLHRDKHDRDDMEKQDLGFGLGFYGDNSAGSARFPSFSLDEKYSSASQTTYSPYTTAKPAQAYLGSAESLVPSFGALRIKNLVPGDVHSSGDEMSRQGSRVGHELGTPREEIPGSTPRFLGLDGMGLEVPWGSAHIRSVCSPSHVSVLQSPSRRSLTAKEEGANRNWEGLPPLPAPSFARNAEGPKHSAQDGWGATIRSSLRSALSVVTGNQTAQPADDDYFTSLPSRTSRSNLPQSQSSVNSRRPQSRASAREDPFQDVPIDDFAPSFSHKPFGHGAGFSGDFSQDVAHAIGTSPLVIRKKSHAVGRRGSNASSESRVILSPGGIYRSTSPRSSTGFTASSDSGGGRKHSTLPVRRKPSQSDRPTILKRGSTSGFSDASFETEASQALNEEEIAARRVMRARRKTSSAGGGGYF